MRYTVIFLALRASLVKIVLFCLFSAIVGNQIYVSYGRPNNCEIDDSKTLRRDHLIEGYITKEISSVNLRGGFNFARPNIQINY